MRVLVIEGDERWITDSSWFEDAEEKLERNGHVCAGSRTIITLDTIMKMLSSTLAA